MAQIEYFDSRLSMDVEFTKTFNCLSIHAAIFVAPRGQLHQSNVSKIKHPMSACAHVVFVRLGNNMGMGADKAMTGVKERYAASAGTGQTTALSGCFSSLRDHFLQK